MGSLQEWPEPIVRVQSLSNSGITVIPDQYIKPPSDRPATANINTTGNTIRIPVIDLGGLAEGIEECQSTMKAISDACKDWGFFMVVNHGVSLDLMKNAREVWRRFFHQPMDFKELYANSPETYEGYGSRLGVENGKVLDWVDYYFLHLLPHSMKDHDKWPAQPSSCREITEEYGREIVRLCGMLMKMMSVSLVLYVDALQKSFGGEDVGACMRVSFYPKYPQPDLTLGLSAHSYPGSLTLLLADDRVTGLQVRKGEA